MMEGSALPEADLVSRVGEMNHHATSVVGQ